MPWLRRLPWVLLLPACWGLELLAARSPETIERWYSRGAYPYLTSFLNLASDALPVSLVELVLAVLALWVFVRSFGAVAGILAGTRSASNVCFHACSSVLAGAGALVALWLGLWGFHYHRVPLAVHAGLDLRPATVLELESLCTDLAQEAGGLRAEVEEDERGVMRLPGGAPAALARAFLGFENAAETRAFLRANYARPKAAFLSPLLSRLGITGIYSPLTAEPHVNVQIADAEMPFTVCHEMAHQIGFAREDEANYLAVVACREHPDAAFRYSGALEALVYAANALYRTDPERHAVLWAHLAPGIRRDLEASAESWSRYHSPARRVGAAVNHVYLKTQGATEGRRSYGAVVDLLLAERRPRAEG